MTKTAMIFSAALLSLSAGTALAEGQGQAGQRGAAMFQNFDFSAADADASGSLTQDEFVTYLSARGDEMRAQRGAQGAQALIAAGDADGDGLLSADELQTALASLGSNRREMRGHDGGEGHGRGGERAGRHGEGDGARAGGGQRGQRLFGRIDRNSDGVIDTEEWSAAVAHMQGRMQDRMQDRAGRGQGDAQSNG